MVGVREGYREKLLLPRNACVMLPRSFAIASPAWAVHAGARTRQEDIVTAQAPQRGIHADFQRAVRGFSVARAGALGNFRQQAARHGPRRELSARVEAELGERAGDVPFDGALADTEVVGDDLVRLPLGDEPHDVALAAGESPELLLRQPRGGGGGPGGDGLGQPFLEPRAQILVRHGTGKLAGDGQRAVEAAARLQPLAPRPVQVALGGVDAPEDRMRTLTRRLFARALQRGGGVVEPL